MWGSGLIQIKWGVFSTNTQGKVNLMLYPSQRSRNLEEFNFFHCLLVTRCASQEIERDRRRSRVGRSMKCGKSPLSQLLEKTSEGENQVETLKRDKARI